MPNNMSNNTNLILKAIRALSDGLQNLSDRFMSIEETIEFMKDQMVTKDGLKEELKQFVTKDDLKQALTPLLTKDEFYRAHDKLIDRIDQVAVAQKEHLRLHHT